ncbi:MAG: Co2+/Mg2+ efflux protein ApaG [Bacteroidia bacterium]|nr:Co2+/Mg2+ efflux protein ApaG [Bacteroidia bacterium]MDW8159037.1 Co2+/Mg2+ efflux protein ApaG [Bacteroidia bacterium]
MPQIENSKITEGIKISVETFFNEDESYATPPRYLFSYHIKISNESDQTVQLLRRHWEITDAYAHVKIVEGEGVIGEQPIILPGKSFEYVSFCILKTPMGKMVGYYEMIKVGKKNEPLKTDIPEFYLVAPFLMN